MSRDEVGGQPLTPYVEKAFGREPSDFSNEFLRELRANWRDVLARSRRLIFVLVVLVGLFVLLAGADVSEISFAGTKLAPSAVDIIATAIPAIIAFLFTQYWELCAMAEQYEDLHGEICKQLYPNLGVLDQALHPPEPNRYGALQVMMLGRSGPAGEKLMIMTSLTSLLVTFLAPFVVIIAMYAVLILDFGVNPLFYAVSLAFSVFYAVRAIGFWKIH